MTCAELYKWMADPSLLTKSSLQELRQMMDDYPYFHAVRMLYLKNLAVLQDVRLEKELRKMSIYIPDRRQLYNLVHERSAAEILNREPEPPTNGKDKTDTVIDVVEKAMPVGEPDEQDFVSTLISKPISPLAATSDYANWLAQNVEDLPAVDDADDLLKHQRLIDSFIAFESNHFTQRMSNTTATKAPDSVVEDEMPPMETTEKSSLDDSYFTETLARVYISQKRYDKALEIIRVLSLKYPKKNRYFADQIRYLEKIINIK